MSADETAAPAPKGTRCVYPDKHGNPCPTSAQLLWHGLGLCHLHHPDLPFAQKASGVYRRDLARTLAELRDGQPRLFGG